MCGGGAGRIVWPARARSSPHARQLRRRHARLSSSVDPIRLDGVERHGCAVLVGLEQAEPSDALSGWLMVRRVVRQASREQSRAML